MLGGSGSGGKGRCPLDDKAVPVEEADAEVVSCGGAFALRVCVRVRVLMWVGAGGCGAAMCEVCVKNVCECVQECVCLSWHLHEGYCGVS